MADQWLMYLSLLLCCVKLAESTTVKCSCVDQLTLYADGTEVGTHDSKTTAATFTIDDNTKIVAIKCSTTSSTTGSAGIIASFNSEYDGDYITDTTWRCTAAAPPTGWSTSTFDDASWSYAVSSGINSNQQNGLTTISDIVSHAHWIWTARFNLEYSPVDTAIYCRGSFGLTRRYDNYGRKFAIGFMDNLSTPIGNKILITTLKPTGVTVYCFTPLLASSNSAYLSEIRTVTSGGGVQVIDAPIAVRNSDNVYNGDKTIVCFATDQVKAVCENSNKNTNDLFLVIPVDALGLQSDSTEYYTVSWDSSDNGQRQRFMIITPYDGTSVTITPKSTITVAGVSRAAGVPFTVAPLKYSIIQVASSSTDLTSTKVVSNKPVVVYSGNQCSSVKGVGSSGSACDHLVEQLTPVSTWGKEFVISPLAYDSDGSRYRKKAHLAYYKIMASKAGTVVTLKQYNSGTLENEYHYNLDEGGVEKYAHPEGYTAYLTSNEGLQVAQIGTSQGSGDCRGDPWMQMIPAVNTFVNDYTILPPVLDASATCPSVNLITVVVKDHDKEGIIIDGYDISEVHSHKPSIIPLGYYQIGETEYYYQNIEVDQSEHRIQHHSPTVNFALYYYGYGVYSSYASMGGVRTYPVNEACSTTSALTLGDGMDNDCDGLIDEDDCGAVLDPNLDCAMPSPINGGWSDYEAEEDCQCPHGSSTGTRKYTRSCSNPVPQYNGLPCEGQDTEQRSCTCDPVDGGWSEWSAWSDCTGACGSGSQTRSRTCTNPRPLFGGADCTGDNQEEQSCNIPSCKVDGGWSEWSATDECTCPNDSPDGTQSFSRSCTNPEPQYGGQDCVGEASEERACTCDAIDGEWSEFGDWSECSGTCGTGVQTRTRTCNNPEPRHGGADCAGEPSEKQECEMDPCPIGISHLITCYGGSYLFSSNYQSSPRMYVASNLGLSDPDALLIGSGLIVHLNRTGKFYIRVKDGGKFVNYRFQQICVDVFGIRNLELIIKSDTTEKVQMKIADPATDSNVCYTYIAGGVSVSKVILNVKKLDPDVCGPYISNANVIGCKDAC